MLKVQVRAVLAHRLFFVREYFSGRYTTVYEYRLNSLGSFRPQYCLLALLLYCLVAPVTDSSLGAHYKLNCFAPQLNENIRLVKSSWLADRLPLLVLDWTSLTYWVV